MSDLIKNIAEAGMGLGSLLVLALVFVYQMRIFERINRTLDRNTDALITNTEVTKALAGKIQDGTETDRKVIEAVNFCKAKSSKEPYDKGINRDDAPDYGGARP